MSPLPSAEAHGAARPGPHGVCGHRRRDTRRWIPGKSRVTGFRHDTQGHTTALPQPHPGDSGSEPPAPQSSSQTHNTHTHTLPQPALQFRLRHTHTHSHSHTLLPSIQSDFGGQHRAGGFPPLSVCTLGSRDPSASARLGCPCPAPPFLWGSLAPLSSPLPSPRLSPFVFPSSLCSLSLSLLRSLSFSSSSLTFSVSSVCQFLLPPSPSFFL